MPGSHMRRVPRVRIANVPRDDICEKRVMPGEYLPTLAEERFSVSRNTVIAAIQTLRVEAW